jgi:hypothetical protein
MTTDPDAEEAQRRVMEAAHQVYFVPSFEGHWIGTLLFGATLVGAAMLYTFLPTAMAVVAGAASDRRAAGTFLALYGAMAVLPVGGWILWGLRRRWAALAVAGLFALCAVWLSPAAVA